MKHKIFIVIQQLVTRTGFNSNAIGDDGDCIAAHYNPSARAAHLAMGLNGSTMSHVNYNMHFGEDNWELEVVDLDEPSAEYLKAYALNQAKVKDAAE